MLKRLMLVIFAVTCLFPVVAVAEDAPRVVVLPFRIHSQEDLSRLQSESPAAIENHLRKQGVGVLKPDALPDTPAAADCWPCWRCFWPS